MIMLNHNLHIFLSVAEKGSITATANELYISQPAVSKAIKNLEDELNLKLFYRDKRKGLLLTDVGKEILLIARQMADLENRMYQTAFRSNNFIGGKVKIASMPILTSVILSKAFYTFRKQYPSVTVELMEGSSMEIRKAIEEHHVDFALLSGPFGSLDYEILFQDCMIAVSREPLVGEQKVDLNKHPERFIFCKAGYETTMEILRANNINMAKSFLVEQADTVIRLADTRNGIGIVSKLVTDYTENHLIRYPIKPEIPIDIGLAANNLKDLTPVAQELKRLIIESVHNISKEIQE